MGACQQFVSPARLDQELFSLGGPVDGGHGPCDTDAQEDVDGVGASDVADRVVSMVVLDGSHLGGESVCVVEKGRELVDFDDFKKVLTKPIY